jgi:hypothetical protein
MELATSRARSASVFARMSADHDRLDEWLASAVAAAERGAWNEVGPPLAAFAFGMAGEFAIEERLIFATFEDLAGASQITATLRAEHDVMTQATRAMRRAAGARDLAAFRDAHDRLMNVLTYHELKEERCIFAELDRRLGPEASATLVAAIDELLAPVRPPR